MVRVISGYLARKPSAAAFHEGRFSTLVQVQTVMLDLPPVPDAGARAAVGLAGGGAMGCWPGGVTCWPHAASSDPASVVTDKARNDRLEVCAIGAPPVAGYAPTLHRPRWAHNRRRTPSVGLLSWVTEHRRPG